jgi:hypothetical protein
MDQKEVSAMDVEKISAEDGSAPSSRSEHEKVVDGIILIPQPSSDPRDPLVRILNALPRIAFGAKKRVNHLADFQL